LAEFTEAPGFLRHLGAILYDLLLLLAMLMIATTIVVIPLSLNGEDVSIGQSPLFRVYLLIVGAGYYLWFWTHGGQTVGMKTWRFRLAGADGADPTLPAALARLLLLLLTSLVGLLWKLVDPQKQTLYDKLAGTRLVVVPKA
jgi:uncharacterized RDD family membrane protein YckC